MRQYSLGLAFAITLAAQTEPSKTTFEDRPAYLLSNGKLELTLLPQQGTSFAKLVLIEDQEKMNPLWEPVRMAREQNQKPTFGGSLGHFVCVDGFGPTSQEERAAGLEGHGEAHRLPFALEKFEKTAAGSTLTMSVTLPVAQERFTRRVTMVNGENVVYVHSELQSLLGFDRPTFWAEHATIGSPFLEPGVTVVDMSAQRSQTRPYKARSGGLPHRLPPGVDFAWPNAPTVDGGTVDLRAAPASPNSGDHTTSLMDPSRELVFITAMHPGKRLLLGYVFRRSEFPWTQIWEMYPPSGKMARGLEFSTQPYDVSRREALEQHSLFNAPTWRLLPAKSTIKADFLMFYARTPEGMQKVDDVRLEAGHLIVEDRKGGKQVKLAASLGLQ